jgi:hypothetical protein
MAVGNFGFAEELVKGLHGVMIGVVASSGKRSGHSDNGQCLAYLGAAGV